MTCCNLKDGRELCYLEAGSGKPLILLHGWSMSSAVFREVMSGLAEDYHVLAPDLAGHGSSEAKINDFDLESLTADLEEWLGMLDVDVVRLLGWSLGGQVALRMTLNQQVRIEKLILVSTTPLFVSDNNWTHGLPPSQVRAMDRQMQRHYEQSMGEFFRLMFDGEEMNQDRYREIIRFAVREGSLPDREIARKGLKLLGNTDLRPQLAAIEAETLVHYGDLDLITVPDACAYLVSQIPGAKEERWQGVGHAPFLSRPVAAVDLWREFLQ